MAIQGGNTPVVKPAGTGTGGLGLVAAGPHSGGYQLLPTSLANAGAQYLPTSLANGGAKMIPTSLANGGAKLLPGSLANGGAQLYNPQIAATLAGTQYNQAITDARQNLAMTQAGAGQAMTNVQNWWNAIIGGEQTAATRDQALTTGVEHAEAGNNAGILASLGGAADPAASSVAVAGQNQQAMLAALGLSNEQYHNDTMPILRQGAAGALGAQQNANQVNIAHAMQGVNDQVAAKGAAQAQNEWQILQANNGILDNRQGRKIDIANANNQILDNRTGRLLQIDAANNTTADNRTNRLIQIDSANNTIADNRVATFQNIVKDNNSTTQAYDQMTETQKNDARNYALQLQQLHDGEKQTKLGVVMSLGFDQKTGSLTPAAQAAIHTMYPNIDPKALTGTSASIVSTITKATISANEQVIKAKITSGEASSGLTNSNHYLTDKNGNAILNKDHTPIPTAGWQLDPKSPTGVSPIPYGQPGSTAKPPKAASTAGVVSDSTAGKLVSGWIAGHDQTTTQRTGTDSQGNPKYTDVHKNGVGGLTYPQMVQRAQAMTDPRSKAAVMAQIDAQVRQGTNSRPYTDPHLAVNKVVELATALKGRGMTYEAAANHILKAAGEYFPGQMQQAVVAGIEQVYGLNPNAPNDLASRPNAVPTHHGAPPAPSSSPTPAPTALPFAPPTNGLPFNKTTGATLPGMLPPSDVLPRR